MCAIIGFVGPCNNHSTSVLQRLFTESSYRGKHSMGVAWWDGHDVQVNLEFEPKLAHVKALADAQGNFRVLGHCRYSTSSLKWPLPLLLRGNAIAMNGVISQDLPANWPGAELEPYETGNDTEIALRYAEWEMTGEHGGSFAVGLLDKHGLAFWRNGSRPLWHLPGLRDGLCVVASTVDILRRSGLPSVDALPVPTGRAWKVEPYGLRKLVHTFDAGPYLQEPVPRDPAESFTIKTAIDY